MGGEESAIRIDELLAESAWIGLARGLVDDPDLAEDLAQEAMLAALRRPPRPGIHPRAWLAGILRNLVAAWRRGDAHRRQREADSGVQDVAGPAELTEAVELQRLLAEALLGLAEPYRQTVLLRYWQGLSSAEIARRTATPEGTVRWRLKRGLDALRERLDAQEGGRNAWTAAIGPLLGTPDVPERARDLLAGAEWARRILLAGVSSAVGALGLFLALDQRAGCRGESGSRAIALLPEEAAAEAQVDPTPPRAVGEARRGLVADLTAKESESARVEIRARAIDEGRAPLSGAVLAADVPGRLRALAAADGSLCIDIARAELPLVGLAHLTLEAPHHLPRSIAFRWRGEPTIWLGNVTLEPSSAIEGRVLDGAGRPAAGAEVLADLVSARPGFEHLPTLPLSEWSYLGSMLADSAPRTTAGADGRYRFDALPARYVRVWARATGSFAAYSEPLGLVAGEAAHCPDLVLPAPGPVELLAGRVLDPRGEAVPNAIVRAWHASRPELFCSGDELAYHATADDEGRFLLPVNPTPALELCARDPLTRWRTSKPLRARGGERELIVRLLVPASLELRASDPDGRPISPFAVELVDARSGCSLGARIELPADRAAPNAEASSLLELSSSAFLLLVRSEGFLEESLGPIDPTQLSGPIVCTLRPAPRIVGKIVFAGSAVEGARIELLLPARGWRSFPDLTASPDPLVSRIAAGGLARVAASDGEGRFELALERASTFLLRAIGPRGESSLVGPLEVPPAGERKELELELAAPGVLGGRVLADVGSSPAGTLVAATRGDGALSIQRVGPDGSFRFDGLGPGRWQVRALARDLDEGGALDLPLALEGGIAGEREGPMRPRWDVDLAAGATTLFDLDLRARARIVLEGELALDGAAPGAWRASLATASEPETVLEATGLDPRGRFRLALAEPGEYELRLWSPGYRTPRVVLSDRVSVRAGGTPWRAELETGLLLPLPGALLESHPEGLRCIWRGPGALAAQAWLRAEEIERGLTYRMPAGTARIVICGDPACDPFGADARIELEIAARETVLLRLD